MTINEYDIVQLVKALPELNLPVGSRGTVVMDFTKYGEPVGNPAYEVEFTDGAGTTLAVVTVPGDALIVVKQQTDSG